MWGRSIYFARRQISFSSYGVLISFENLRTAVFNPAKEKLHPPLLIMGIGRSNFLGSPFFERISICGPPGNSIPKILVSTFAKTHISNCIIVILKESVLFTIVEIMR